MLTYIDHVTIAVRDIEVAASSLRTTFSLAVTRCRVDEEAGLANAIIPLIQGYIELVAPTPLTPKSSSVARRLATFLETREGLFTFALNSSDIQGDVSVLRERGSTLGKPQHQPSGDAATGGWWSAIPEHEDLEPYIIQSDAQLTQSMTRVGARQPLGIRSIEEVTLVIPDAEACVKTYDRDLGLPLRRRLGRQFQLGAGASRVMLVPSSTAPLGTPIGLYSVSLGTTDVKGAQAELRGRGVDLVEPPFSWGVSAQIDTARTFGARINLVQL